MTHILEKHFYGRRRNRGLHKQRQEAYDSVSERFFITAPVDDDTDPAVLFAPSMPREIWLEIGFGYGEHLTHQAGLHPDVGLLAIEPFINGIAVASIAMVEQDLHNIRIYPDDAMHVLPRLRDNSLSRVFLFFPDPWPKARHHKRRFIQPESVALLARLLKPGGTLHMATDIPDLADWMIAHVTAHPNFTWTAQRATDRITPPEHWVMTKFQDKAIREGRGSQYMDFVRI